MNDREQVRSLLTLAAEPPGDPLIAPVQELVIRARVHRRRRQVALAAGLTLVAVLTVTIPVSLLTRNPRPAGIITQPALTPAPSAYPTTGPASAAEIARGHWSRLPAAPIPGRSNPAAVWTGREMLVWGGAAGAKEQDLRGDGAAYDPAAGRWQTLPAGPLNPRTAMGSVWTGQAMFIWGGYDHVAQDRFHATATGALYIPASRTWRALPPAPLPARVYPTAAWTGSEVVVLGGRPAVSTAADGYLDAAAYNPATKRWRTLPVIPSQAGHTVTNSVALAAANHIYAWLSWQHTEQHGDMSTGSAGTDLLRYDPSTEHWTRLATTGDTPRGLSDPVWTGQEIVMPAARTTCGGGCPMQVGLHGERLDPASNTWRPIAHGPVDDVIPLSWWTGAALLSFDNNAFIGGSSAVYPGAAA
ncbi:MAG TPA: hypothetical protein VGN54_02530, partial [Mycobacteriales bacterium]|nr:hypothetical protein [Mycobacteriales bacterium]